MNNKPPAVTNTGPSEAGAGRNVFALTRRFTNGSFPQVLPVFRAQCAERTLRFAGLATLPLSKP